MTIFQNDHALDMYDSAVLAGGPHRLVDTVLVSLKESGLLRIDASGEFRADASSPHPVEAAALDAIGTRGHRSVDTIRHRLVRDRRVTQVCERLTDDRLIRRTLPSRLLPKKEAYTRTAAGRRALRRLEELPPAVGGSAAVVAVHGRGAMPDRRLHDEIFERPPVVLPPRSARRPSRVVDPGELSRTPRHKSVIGESAYDPATFERGVGGGTI